MLLVKRLVTEGEERLWEPERRKFLIWKKIVQGLNANDPSSFLFKRQATQIFSKVMS